MKKIKQRNFVQKYVQDFTKPQTFVDRKKENKKGYAKHKHSFARDLSGSSKMIFRLFH